MQSLTLAGVNILDLSRVLAGPLCTMMLGDLGANVVKVERPGLGDDTRGWGPPFDDRGESAYFLSINRNKMSVAADLAVARDRDFISSLIADADVVVDNFRPTVLQRLGMDVDEILKRHPRLVWCTISGFGEQSRRPGYDFVVQAEGGWMAVTGSADGEPTKAGVALADILAGKDATIRILAALVARSRGDAVRERRLHVSLIDSARAALINVAQNAMISGADAPRWGNAHANLVPYQLFHAQDRPMVIAVGTDEQWRACTAALGLTQLGSDERLASNAGRVTHRDHVVREITRAIAQRPAADWIQSLTDHDVPCGVVKTVLEVIAEAAGSSPVTGMPSSVGGTVRMPPPRLDEHGPQLRREGWRLFGSR